MQTRSQRKKAAITAADAARSAVVHSSDLLSLILRHHAAHVGGWNGTFLQAGLVCKAWHAGVLETRPMLEAWGELTWDATDWLYPSATGAGPLSHHDIVAMMSQPMITRSSPPFPCGGGAYHWHVELT